MNKQITVCHISDCLPVTHNSWGGAEQACWRLIEASAQADLDVAAITTKFDIVGSAHNIRVFSVPAMKLDILRSMKQLSIPFDFVSLISVFKTLKKIRPDIVHLHRINTLSLSVVCAASFLDIPVVASIYDYFYFCPKETLITDDGRQCQRYHGSYCVICMDIKKPHLLKKRLIGLRKYFFKFLQRKVCYHVLSESSLNILISYGIDKEKIFNIPQIYSRKDNGNLPVADKGMILYIGWIQERKGLHVLLEGMPEIIRFCPCAHIVAIGAINNDAYFDKIKNLIKTNGFSKKITLLGKRDYDVVTEYMKKANVIVIPEQWENMSPVVLVEAMSLGKPVVASNIGGIPEFLIDGENGFLCDPVSPKDFADKVVKILNDEYTAKKFGSSARQHIIKLMDDKRIINEYKDMYNKLIGG